MSSYSNELLMLIFRSMLFKQVIILFAYGCLYYLVTHFIDKKIQHEKNFLLKLSLGSVLKLLK
ncbi:membrane protein [Lactiplantibacillus plantarum]|nr:membrane protein [Lactiplantibacillus plantarum]MCG0816431.1 membrane protein [Lactiplantibacillus plantarum]MCG0819499.1 membrane protein [Lactiplantibacillus plantarum]MCG0841570.1 membrane protein [Lactiplantibacillus plantarum]MCG0938591.1 membrane protein [Lactiplantibacillus plantarum]